MNHQPKKLSVYILSNSRSLYSTRRLFEEATKKEHRVKVFPPIDLSVYVEKRNGEIYFQNKKILIPDCIIPRIGIKKMSYTLGTIRQFEILGSASLNASQAIGRSRDKLRTLQIISQTSIGMPKTMVIDSLADVETVINRFEMPLIIKLLEGTQGVGVLIAESKRSARSILESLLNQGQLVMIQEFIKEASGSDIRAIILGGRLIAAMRRRSNSDDFRSNIHRGGTYELVKLTYEAEKVARMAAATMGLQFAGVDLVESNRGPLVLEVNSSPGLEGIESATGVNVAGECINYLEKLVRIKNRKDQVGF